MSSGAGGAGYVEKLWSIVDLDRGDFFFGQFVPQSVTKEVSANYAEVPTLGRQNPIMQWLNGVTETLTFTARLWANNADESIEERVEKLENLVKRQADLPKEGKRPKGRPPVCEFQWGSDRSLKFEYCFVTSLGGVTYDELRPDGSLRGATMSITIKRYDPVTLTVTDPTVPESQTRIRLAKKGDTYESIALDEYGNPELGIPLRQLNPRIARMELADLNPQDPVHVYSEDYLLTTPIQPKFHAFKIGRGNEDAEQRRREMFDDRDGDSFTTVFADYGESER